jgi:amino-acid N-acetyltransferase
MEASLEPAIRRSRASDLAAVLALLKGAGLPTDDLTIAPGLHFWVLESEQDLCGVIGLERFGTAALLRSLAIAPGRQGRGWGRQLVTRVERDAQADGVEQLVLLTETAEEFFRGLGYGVIDRGYVIEELKQSAEFRSLCPASAACMTKSLVSPSIEARRG